MRRVGGVLLLCLTLPALASAPAGTRAARTVNVVGLDYAFEIPRELPAGPTLFRFENHGQKRHEFNVFLIKRGLAMDSVMALLRADQPARLFSDGGVGVLFARRNGGSSAGELFTELQPDRDYAVICVLRDTPDAPRHWMLGMYSVIHVLPAPPAGASREPVPIDTVAGLDYAYRYRRTLPPGQHAFAFRNEGKVRHELSIVALKPGVTLDSMLRTEQGGGNVARLIASDLGLLHAPAGQQALGMLEGDLAEGSEYVLFCTFSDSAGAPTHDKLGMVGSIHVHR